jgi:hypothetical protein
MAIPYDIDQIELKLNSFNAKAERVRYLSDYLFKLQKRKLK